VQHHHERKCPLATTRYLSGWDFCLNLMASRWHSFASFSPSRSTAFATRLPLLSGFPISAIHPMKTQECGWLRERSEMVARDLWTSYQSIQSCKAATCFPYMGKRWFRGTSLMWHPLKAFRYSTLTSLRTTIPLSYFPRKPAQRTSVYFVL
jgi:hypothetical protein